MQERAKYEKFKHTCMFLFFLRSSSSVTSAVKGCLDSPKVQLLGPMILFLYHANLFPHL